MSTALLRQDPIFKDFLRFLAVLVGVGLFLVTFLLSLSAWFKGTEEPAYGLNYRLVFTAVWITLCIYLLSPGVRTRTSSLGLALPVGARRLWLTHQAAVFLGGFVIVFILGGLVLGGGWLMVRRGGPALLGSSGTLDLVVYLPLGLAVAVALLQAPVPFLQRIPLSRGYLLYSLTSLATGLLFHLTLASLPLPFVALPLLAAGGLAWRTYRSVPPGFVVAPRDPVPGVLHPVDASAESWTSAPTHGLAYQWFLFQTVHRMVAKKLLLPILGGPILVLLGMALSGFFIPLTEGGLRYNLLVIAVYMLLAFFGGHTHNLHRVDTLPISRRRLFAMLTLPSVLTLVVGYGVGLFGLHLMGPRELIHFQSRDCCGYIVVPAARCEIAWDGAVPENTSPWGESHPAWSVPIFRGGRVVMYSPYSNTEQSSREYVARQISRATEVVYNRGITAHEIATRYLETEDNGTVRGSQEDLTLVRDHPDLRPRSAGPAFPVIMAMVGVPAFLLMAFHLRWFRAGISVGRRNAVAWITLALLLALHLSQYVLFAVEATEWWIVPGVIKIGIRHLGEAFPGSTLVVWVVSGLLLLGAYRVAEWAFERIEVIAAERGRICVF